MHNKNSDEPVQATKFFSIQDECYGKNYLSFLDFTRRRVEFLSPAVTITLFK